MPAYQSNLLLTKATELIELSGMTYFPMIRKIVVTKYFELGGNVQVE